MPSREEALRKILDAAAGELTDEQRRELVAHLDDSVEAKVAAGTPEMDAVAQAFVELGDLGKIARQFPRRAAAVTPEGAQVETAAAQVSVWTAYAVLVFFVVVQTFITPKFAEVFQQLRVPLPTLTILFLNVSSVLSAAPVVVGLVLAGLAVTLYRYRRVRFPRRIALAVGAALFALCVGLVAGLFLPLTALLEGISR